MGGEEVKVAWRQLKMFYCRKKGNGRLMGERHGLRGWFLFILNMTVSVDKLISGAGEREESPRSAKFLRKERS